MNRPALLRTSPAHAALRLVLLVAPPAAVLLTVPAGAGPAAWLVALVVLVSAVWAAFPESAAGAAALFLVVAWWGLGLRNGMHPAALGAAALVVTAHVAATVTSYGPATMPLERAVALRWLLRGALAFAAAPLVYVVVRATRDAADPPGIWLAGAAAATAALLVANVLMGRRTVS